MILTERIEVSDKIIASGGFADVRTGEFMGGLVAVKTIRVAEKDDILKIRKVSAMAPPSPETRPKSFSSNFVRKPFYGVR